MAILRVAAVVIVGLVLGAVALPFLAMKFAEMTMWSLEMANHEPSTFLAGWLKGVWAITLVVVWAIFCVLLAAFAAMKSE